MTSPYSLLFGFSFSNKIFSIAFLLVWYNYDNKLFCHCKSFSTNRKFYNSKEEMSHKKPHPTTKWSTHSIWLTDNISIVYLYKNLFTIYFMILYSLPIDQVRHVVTITRLLYSKISLCCEFPKFHYTSN